MDRSRSSSFVALGALLVAFVVGSSLLGAAAALVVPVGRTLVADSVEWELPEPELQALAARSSVYDVHGNRIAVLHSGENRAPISLDEVPAHLVHAVLAAEDRNFYEHDGVDWRGIGRALAINLDAGSVRQGGSTVTQQLVKNTMFDDPDRDLDRKVKEAVLAMGVEQRYTKDEILEMYLNTIYLGNGAYGARAAAERYFAKPVSELDLGEAALIAGLIANPEGRDPVRHPDHATRARSQVLDAMLEEGWATEAEVVAARATPLPHELRPVPADPIGDPFVEEVKRQLLRDERLGETYQERYRRLFEGGLRIYTTYDQRLQAAAELAVRNVLPDDVDYTAALVVIDNATGAVRAMVPGTDFEHAGFNLATQGARQTGSAYKTVTLAAAIEDGFAPDDRVDASGRCSFLFDERMPEWNVRNYDSASYGTLTLSDAIARSSNCAFARVVLALGAEKVVDMSRRLGIRSDLEAVPSITLGTQPVSPLEMTAAYATLASDGVRHTPRFLDRVESATGEVLFEERPDPQQLVEPHVARTVTHMLTRVITSGTARGADVGRPAAGKTGANPADRDAWVIGYTPQYTAGVWIGNAEAQIPVVIEGRRVTGGSYPARIWRDFMRVAHEGVPVVDFPAPDSDRWPRAGTITEEGRNIAPLPTAPPRTDPTPDPEPTTVPEPQPTVPEPPPPTAQPAPAPPAPEADGGGGEGGNGSGGQGNPL